MDTEKEVAEQKEAARKADAAKAAVPAKTDEDKAAEAARDNVTTTSTNEDERRKAQIERTERKLEQRSDANEEGHAKLVEATEKAAAQSAEHKAPTSGREYNRNTPVIDKDGNKHWPD